jgi:hypothetical protein
MLSQLDSKILKVQLLSFISGYKPNKSYQPQSIHELSNYPFQITFEDQKHS